MVYTYIHTYILWQRVTPYNNKEQAYTTRQKELLHGVVRLQPAKYCVCVFVCGEVSDPEHLSAFDNMVIGIAYATEFLVGIKMMKCYKVEKENDNRVVMSGNEGYVSKRAVQKKIVVRAID